MNRTRLFQGRQFPLKLTVIAAANGRDVSYVMFKRNANADNDGEIAVRPLFTLAAFPARRKLFRDTSSVGSGPGQGSSLKKTWFKVTSSIPTQGVIRQSAYSQANSNAIFSVFR